MKTPITYYGGKQTLLKYILPLIPRHNRYTESFCGGAALFFAKEKVASEVINDFNGELINFYWVAQVYYSDLKVEINKTLHSRDIHAHAKHISTHPVFFSPVQRAWAVWVQSKMSFASQQNGSFGYDFTGGMPKKLRNAKDHFTEILCKRLENVTIENKDAFDILTRYDGKDTFHFIDPPYVGTACGNYEKMFSESHLVLLLDLLAKMKGKFMLTMFPNNHIKKFAEVNGWVIHSCNRTISAAKIKRREQEEWIVCNYSLTD